MSEVSLEYAKSLYSLAKDILEKEEILESLTASLDIFKGDIAVFFGHPEIRKETKKEIIQNSFKKSIFRDFLMVLIDNGRLSILKDIRDDYSVLYYEELNVEKVTVFSREKLSIQYLNALKAKLKKKIGKTVIIRNVTDESIKAGIRIRYGSEEIDLTLNRKFSSFVGSLKE